MAEDLGASTPYSFKRPNTEMDVSPVGTFSLSDISSLMDRKLQPILEQLGKIPDAAKLENRIQQLESENRFLREKIERQERYSRRENIRVLGIKEHPYENCEEKLLNVFKSFCSDFNDRTFIQVHRLGRLQKYGERPIMARFHHLKDKISLLRHSSEIYQRCQVRIMDDLPQEVEARRRTLLPILHAAKSYPEYCREDSKPKLVEDKLRINGKTYGVHNLSQLPKQLHLENVMTPSKNNITAFFSKFSPLSNHYPSEFKVNGEAYNCMEQFFMVTKAEEFGDQEAIRSLKRESDPVTMKNIGKKIKHFDNHRWLSVAEGKIKAGLVSKFSQNPFLKDFLLSTGDTKLVEASQDKIWSAGKSLKDKDLWKPEKWSGKNWLGEMLMKVRSELKK